ncbi:MAG: hypothetical protein RIR00_2076 [Pseudomonadota bacterium]|jgi:hypothetical protein
MPCCASPRIDTLLRAFVVWLLFWQCTAGAAEVEIRQPQLSPGEDGYALSADFVFDFNPRLEEAVAKGVVLYFVAEFELTRSRWYWFDDKVLRASQVWRLSYHALTRQYRLSTGVLHQNFSSLEDALRVLSRLRNWVVLEKGSDRSPLKPGETYQAALRLYLDHAQLPKPFQIAALASKEWNLASDWQRWPHVAPVPPAAAPAEVK